MKKRVVVAGLGDTGLLVALALRPEFEVVGVSPKPCLVSGQELGTRLARPDDWRRDYLISFSRYRRLAGMPVRHGLLTRMEPEHNRVFVEDRDGVEEAISYDALVLSMGVTNGFWRNAEFQERKDVERGIDGPAAELAAAKSIAVVGGGATGVSAASNLKEAHPRTRVTLFSGRDEILPGYHPRTRRAVAARLERQGVELRPRHRAEMPPGFSGERLTREPLAFSSGQPLFHADVVLWAVGIQRPNTAFVPSSMLDERGYVKADARLRVPGFANVFTVGDVAASDPNRSSARNSGFVTVAHNVRCVLGGRDADMKSYKPTKHRWGSILGVQNDGLRVFAPTGLSVRIGRFWVDRVLFPLVVRRGIYKGIDEE